MAGEVAIEGATIRSIVPLVPLVPVGDGDADGAADRSGELVIDLTDRWLVPGYIDGHVHGGGGGQFNSPDRDEIATVARFHARHGTTALLATTVAAPPDELAAALTAIAGACGHGGPAGGAEILGAHLEGPWLSPRRPGAMDPACFLHPDRAVVRQLRTACSGVLRQVTLAPELPGALELIGELAGDGVLVSLGHSDAGFEQVQAAVAAGARSATHVFNAMAPLHHRAPGLLGAALDLEQINCELIADGVHVSAPAMRLVRRAKGAGGLRLVTDAMAGAGMPAAEHRLGTRPVLVRDGRATLVDGESLAGSTLTMDVAVRNAVALLGLSVGEAVSLASANPARVLGVEGRKGAIAPGRDADLAVLDDGLRCVATMVGGRWARELAGPGAHPLGGGDVDDR